MTSAAPATYSGHVPPIRVSRSISLILMAALMSGSCAYFNTFYNARDYYRRGVKSLEMAGLESQDELLPPAARSAFEKAIEKSHKVVDDYSGSKYVTESLYIIARSNYYLGEMGLAERYLSLVLDASSTDKRATEARLFLAKTHHRMGLLGEVESDLAPLLESKRTPGRILAEVHVLQGEIAIGTGDVQGAIKQFQLAAQYAPRDAIRAQIYFRLFTLLRGEGLLREALNIHDRYRRYTPSVKERQEAVLTRIQLLQELGDLEVAYEETRAMLNLSEFKDVAPGLQLELAKVENARGNEPEYLSQLENIKAEFRNLPVASEAAFLLAEHSLLRSRDFEAAKNYYVTVKPSTPSYAQAKARLKQLERLAELKGQLSSLVAESPSVAAGADSGNGASADAPLQKLPNSGDATAVASLLYRLGEIAFIDLADTVQAMEYMAHIYHQYGETPAAPKAVYILYLLTPEISDQHQFWESVLLESYGQSQIAGMLAGRKDDFYRSGIDRLATLADDALQTNPAEALRLFEQIRDRYHTEQSTFAIAYIYDVYLANLELAISGYEEHLDKHAKGLYSEVARERLNFLLAVKASAN